MRTPLRPLAPALLAGLLALGPLAGCAGRQTDAAPAGAASPARSPAESPAEAPRVVALGGAVAETVYALGAEVLLVARDASAVYPEAVTAKPSVGYYRQVGAEGVLSTGADLVLASPDAGPPEALGQIEGAGVRLVRLPGGHTPDAARALVRAIAEAVGREADGERVVAALDADLRAAEAVVAQARASGAAPPRVLFVLGQGGSTLSMAGADTGADAFLRLAGGANAFGNVDGYKPVTPEALVGAAPDVVFMLGRTAQAVGGAEAFAARPEVAATPAGRAGRVLVVEDHALNFGPGLGASVRRFAEALHAAPAPGAPTAARP